MPAETLSRYVTCNSEILSGEPIIIGTRTSVRDIVGLWRMGIMANGGYAGGDFDSFAPFEPSPGV